jgi:hypothetical protein
VVPLLPLPPLSLTTIKVGPRNRIAAASFRLVSRSKPRHVGEKEMPTERQTFYTQDDA